MNRQIGRILQQNQRAAARFEMRLQDADCPAGFLLKVEIKPSFDEWAELSEAAYLLRSNITGWSDERLWKAYIQLTQAEAAFRIQEDQLCLRPIWHQRADRAQAHILVCFLAFALGEIRLRCITQPDAAQAALLDRLGITLPKRMRLNDRDRLPLSA